MSKTEGKKPKATEKRRNSAEKSPPGAYDAAVDGMARATIIGALVAMKGSRTEAAKALGMTLRRLYREIDRLEKAAPGLKTELDRLSIEHNWPANPGSDVRWGQG
jgi:DNA-binding NtrC family response regulator